jgi:hypothetical protein
LAVFWNFPGFHRDQLSDGLLAVLCAVGYEADLAEVDIGLSAVPMDVQSSISIAPAHIFKIIKLYSNILRSKSG